MTKEMKYYKFYDLQDRGRQNMVNVVAENLEEAVKTAQDSFNSKFGEPLDTDRCKIEFVGEVYVLQNVQQMFADWKAAKCGETTEGGDI